MNDHPLSGNPRPANPGPKAQISEYQKAGEFLAAERTFLAWIRTGISIISLGFVIAKFGLWLHELAARLDPKIEVHGTGMSLPIGIGMMGLGGALALLALWHFHAVNRAIEQGQIRANAAWLQPWQSPSPPWLFSSFSIYS